MMKSISYSVEKEFSKNSYSIISVEASQSLRVAMLGIIISVCGTKHL